MPAKFFKYHYDKTSNLTELSIYNKQEFQKPWQNAKVLQSYGNENPVKWWFLLHVEITNSVNSTSDLSETSTYFMVLGSTFSFTLSLLMYCIVLVSSCVCAPRSIPTMATGAHDNNGRNNPCKHLFITYKHLLHEYLIGIQSFKMNEFLLSMTWRDKNWKLLYIDLGLISELKWVSQANKAIT